jgi:hypothetical protein
LNATVKAEEIGKSGASLSVVSDFIKQLAEDSNVKAYAVSDGLKSITNAIGELSAKAGKWLLIDESDVKSMSEKLSIMDGTFHVVNTNIFSLLDDFEKNGCKLASDMQQVAENINVHITVDKIVRDIVFRFKTILQQGKQTCDSKGIIGYQEDIYVKNESGNLLKRIEKPSFLSSKNDKAETGLVDSEENVELF